MSNLDKLLKEFKDARSASTQGEWEVDVEHGQDVFSKGNVRVLSSDPRWNHSPGKISCYNNLKFSALAANKSDKLIKIIEVMREAMEKSWWKDGHPDKVYGSEWFIAKLKNGRKVVLRELPDDYSYDYKTADETYFTKDWIVKWMPFPDGEFISPNDEALQQAEQIAGQNE